MTTRIRPFTMSCPRRIALALLFVSFVALAGSAMGQNPVPFVNQPLVPDARVPGGSAFALTVRGTGFVSGSVVNWNGSPLATTFVSASQLTASVPASDIAKASTASVTVVSPGPGGGSSNVAFFEVTIASSAIVLTTSVLRAGVSPAAVAVGDFNHDGKLDMAVANNASASVSILLGKGHGMFKSAADYGLGFGSHHPNSAAVGDFNGDGKLDLVVANGGSNDVSVFLGNGDGTFRAAVDYVTNSDLDSVEPSSVTVGDFNRDGNLDLAVANPGGLSVLLGNGDGTFKPFVSYAAGSTPFWVAAGDFNRDGKLDLVVANEGSNNISVLLGKGDGTFEAAVNYATGSKPASVAVGDFNADGKLDLAVANLGSNSVSVLLGNGDGTFRTTVDYGAGSAPRWVTVGDLNGDGKLDLVVANNAVSGGTPGVSVLLGNGNGTFKSDVEYAVGSEPESVALGDFDGDGRLDIAVADIGSSSQVFVLSTSAIFANQVVGTSSPKQPVTLTNYGTNPLSITGITITGSNAADFAADSGTCGSPVAPGASCTIEVTFTPSQIGTRTATLSITDSGPGGSQNVMLNGAGTVVELVPNSLTFSCSSSCPPPSQAVKLTNTGSTTLTLSITITGANPTDFSQANDCGTSVGQGKYCTITVTFAPTKYGRFIADVSISDNGGGSPQQVALLGTKTKRGMSSAVRSALSTTQTAAVPRPTGPSQVGARIMDLVDSTRDDQFLANGTKRELLVRFWYPMSLTQGCESAEYTAPAVWSYFSQLARFPLPEVKTNSCLDAPITESPHPVIVFTHGYTGTFTDYTFLFEDLASRGYVVASLDHTSEATAVEFPDGRFVKSVFGSHLDESTWRRDEQSLSFAVSVRSKDLKFVVDELARLNSGARGPFAGKLDLTRVAVAGHSLGGLAALLGLKQEARFKAAVLLDASVPDGSASVTDTPVLVLAMGREQWSDEECRLWSDLRGPRLAVNLKGAEHLTPSDAVWLANGAIKTGPMGTEKSIAAVRDYIAAFLDANLRGKPPGALLTRSSADYPDAEVTTQKQLLCGEGMDH
jgi:dienelactone hydrolase